MRVLGQFVLHRMSAHQISEENKAILTAGTKDDASEAEKQKLKTLYINVGRKIARVRNNLHKKVTSSGRSTFLSGTFFRFK